MSLLRTSSPRTSKGFTLVELLVVIAIIGILAAIVLASLSTARAKGRDARRISDVKQLQLALELFNDANSGYPVTPSGGVSPSTLTTSLVTPGFISVIPTDPTNISPQVYTYESTDGAGSACTTGTAGSNGVNVCPGYVLETVLETNSAQSGLTGTIAGINCTPGSSGPYTYCVTN